MKKPTHIPVRKSQLHDLALAVDVMSAVASKTPKPSEGVMASALYAGNMAQATKGLVRASFAIVEELRRTGELKR